MTEPTSFNSAPHVEFPADGVPFFRYPHVYTSHRAEFLKIIDDVCSRGAFILQNDLINFEIELATFVGSSHATGVANCTDGLEICLKAAGLGSGDEVIISSHTFVATAAAVRNTGAIPVPVECGRDHLLDVHAAEAAITSHTRAIVPTHLNGRICDMTTLSELVLKYDLILIEDAAQALGARYRDKQAGTFGDAGVFSFYPAKNLGCFGDGGAIVTDNTLMWERLSKVRNHGRAGNGYVRCWGENSRLDNLHAAILSFKLTYLEDEIDKRRLLARIYEERLSDVEEVVLPPGPHKNAEYFDTYQNYEIEAQDRESLIQYLTNRRIGTSKPWGGWAVHQFAELGFNLSLPVTESIFNRILLLPMNTSLTVAEAEYVADTVREFYYYPN